MSREADRAERTGYALIDAGDWRRLERFGTLLVDRPAPTTTDAPLAPDDWRDADLRFDGDAGTWSREVDPWPVELEGLVLELRPTSSGGVGLFPEHLENMAWLAAQVRSRARDRQPSVLNLFAHTGLATLVAARAGAAVAHVDAARAAVAGARRNAELSGLADRRIRWLVDDAVGFVAREARRGRRYDGIVLDPPSFGRAGNRRWQLAEALPELLAACRDVATDEAFVLLSAHTTGVDGEELAWHLADAFEPAAGRATVDVVPLTLHATSGAGLDLGWAARLPG